jgi:hypothetical protein
MKPMHYLLAFVLTLTLVSAGILYAYPYIQVVEFAILQGIIYTLYALFVVYSIERSGNGIEVAPT